MLKRSIVAGFLAVLGAPSVSAQSVPIALQGPSDTYTIWGAGTLGLGPPAAIGVSFLPIELAGYPSRDRLRISAPRIAGVDGPAPHLLLPQGGALYRVQRGQATSLLSISGAGDAAIVLSVANASGQPGLQSRISVSSSSTLALAATTLEAGGNVLLVDLAADPSSVVDLTSTVGPLDVDPVSLRISEQGAFWVAGGELWRAPAGAGALVVDAGVTDLPVLGDMALSADGRRVAAVAGSEDVELADRIVFVVDVDGSVAIATPVADSYSDAGTEQPLGPFLALSEDGSLVAFRQGTDVQEVFVKEVGFPEPPLQLTVEAFFPAYIDNAAILGFTSEGDLLFFAGDVTISGVDAQEVMGAADLYRTNLAERTAPTFENLSLSSGQVLPPYDLPGQLQFTEAVFDPMGQRFLLIGEDAAENQTLSSVTVAEGGYATTWALLASGADSDPQLVPAGSAVLILSEFEQDVAGEELEWQRLELLPSLHADGSGQLILVGDLPSSVTVDRFASRAGAWAAFVVGLGPGFELPVFVAIPSGLALPALWQLLGVSPVVAFSSAGDLAVGLGGAGGPYQLASFGSPGLGAWMPTPTAHGFPLSY